MRTGSATGMRFRVRLPGVAIALWRYRGFIAGNVAREFRLRYTGSVLGVAWNLLQPLAQVLIYVVVFSQVMQAHLPGSGDRYVYSVYVLGGMLVWTCFSDIVGRCVNLFVDNANLLKKAAFPRVTLLASAILSSLVNLGLIALVFFAALAIIGRFPGWIVVTLLVPLAVTVVFAAGLGILLGTLNVLFRDVGQFTGIALQFWFWLTPIVYPPRVLPDPFQGFAARNPLSPLVSAFHSVLLQGHLPDWASLGFAAIVASIVFILGYALFKGNVATLVDEL
jgi:homopolymeric O-antigen transport system permease protein